jgi:hypothetical protein
VLARVTVVINNSTCGLTENDDIENQDDEADDSTAGTILPGVAVSSSGDLLGHREGGEKQETENFLEHGYSYDKL